MSAFDVFRKNVPLERSTGGSYVNGRYVANTETVTLKASVQPTSEKDLMTLPEGRRDMGSYTLYSEQPIYAAEQEGQNADIVTLYGDRYEVIDVARWGNGVIDHYKAIVVRI